MTGTPISEAEILAFFQQDVQTVSAFTDEEFAQLCALTTPDYVDPPRDIDAFFSELGILPRGASEAEAAPATEPEPLTPVDMSPPEFVAFCGYDPSEFNCLKASQESENVDVWSGVFQEIVIRLEQTTAASSAFLAEMNAKTAPITSY